MLPSEWVGQDGKLNSQERANAVKALQEGYENQLLFGLEQSACNPAQRVMQKRGQFVVGEDFTQEIIDSSNEYTAVHQILSDARLKQDVDFEYLCISGFPDDLDTGAYFLALTDQSNTKTLPLGPAISRSTRGMITKVEESPTNIFKGIQPFVFFMIFLTPFIIGLASYLYETDYHFLYHISNYLGLLYFQPEINLQGNYLQHYF